MILVLLATATGLPDLSTDESRRLRQRLAPVGLELFWVNICELKQDPRLPTNSAKPVKAAQPKEEALSHGGSSRVHPVFTCWHHPGSPGSPGNGSVCFSMGGIESGEEHRRLEADEPDS